MDLLQENKKKNKKTTGQKIILTLLIISIILIIAIVGVMLVMGNIGTKSKYTIAVNGNIVSEEKIGFLQLEDGSKYISIRALCNQLNYEYFNGEYNIAGESKDKGYINNGTNIVQFFADSNDIYKTEENEVKDYEYYKLKNNIIQYNETLYINMEDLTVAFNLIEVYSEEKNQTIILTPEYWLEKNNAQFDELGYTVSETPENKKAISYGYVIIQNNEKYGVINLGLEELIGNKYNSINFVEYTGQFIVSNNNDKYGVININGSTEIALQYDSIEILNYNPLLYQVERLEEYGIMRQNGEIINEIKYTSLGYPEDKANNIYYTLIIPELNENIPQSIVVCKDGKYGLVNLENGKEVIPCNLKGIFKLIDIDRGLEYYVVQYENGNVTTLENYVNSINQITANINN